MEKTIYIIGAGAIGKALAVFLKLKGRNVLLVRGSVDQGVSTYETIKIELPDQLTLEATIEVTSLSQLHLFDGIVLLTTKSFGNESLAKSLYPKIGHAPMVVMQNGLEVEQPFLQHGFPEIYRCVLFATSQSISESMIRYKPVAVSQIGVIRGNDSQLQEIITQLENDHFKFAASSNIQSIIWKKAIANSVFNSVCPLLEIDNGLFHRNDKAKEIATRIIKECVSIANEVGVTLEVHEVMNSLLMISKNSDGQLISTLQDIKMKRRTEIETLNFSIVNIARQLNKERWVTETKLLGELTKLKSDLTLVE
ncbi:MAG: ketopantoate reductase family protein [Cyclobacteriaceae bacterium]|jgi:2-dehydropantoate 2-reductase|nr:2-dehydropantoate 2-reductase [Flammeovirgaceae bacterium]